MSMFGSILGKIFGHAAAATPSSTPSAPASPSTTAPSPGGGPPAAPPTSFNNPTGAVQSPASTSPSSPTGGAAAAPKQPVDVAAILDGLASKNAQQLDWKHSIVDLLKLLDLDSSHSSREELAKELHYSGSTSDSAAMNIWLHKQVMQKLAENGGKVPDDLK
jgi:Domain of unknown function (DUF3597)